MPDIYLDVDVALSEVPVNVLPLIDATDFKTIKDAVVYNAAGMTLRWHFVTSGGAYTVTSVTPTSGGDYDWTDQGDSGIYTIEIPASGGASINNDTEGYGWFTGQATGVLPWRGPVIGFRAAGLNNLLLDNAYSATRGLAGTALPDAAADAAGGLPVSDAGGLDLDARLDAAVSSRSTLTQTQVTGGAYALNSASFSFDTAFDFTSTQKTSLNAATPASVTGAVGSVTGNVGGNVTGSVGSVTGNVGGNVTGSVGSLAAQAKLDVNAEVDSAIETYHLDHLLAATYDPASKPGAADALLNELVESDGGVSRFTANALEEAPSGGGSSDWTADEKTAIKTILGVPASGTTPDDPSDGALADIKAKTDQLTFTTANRVDSQVYGMENDSITAAAIATGAIDADAIAADAITSAKLADGALAAAKIADNAITAAKIADGAFDAVWSVASRTLTAFGFNVTLHSDYDAAKTAAQPGDEMDLVDAPNATAVAAIQDGLATEQDISDLQTHGDGTWTTATGFSTHSAADVATALGDGSAFTEAGGTGDHLTALATQASVNTIDGNVDTILADLVDGGRLDLIFDAILADTANLSDTTMGEISGASDAPADATLKQGMRLLYMWLRNNTSSTADERRIRNDAGTVVLEGNMSDDGTVFQQGRLGAAD